MPKTVLVKRAVYEKFRSLGPMRWQIRMRLAFSVPMDGMASMTGSQIANREVRKEEISLSGCAWLDIELGVPAQDEAGPPGSTDAWDI